MMIIQKPYFTVKTVGENSLKRRKAAEGVPKSRAGPQRAWTGSCVYYTTEVWPRHCHGAQTTCRSTGHGEGDAQRHSPASALQSDLPRRQGTACLIIFSKTCWSCLQPMRSVNLSAPMLFKGCSKETVKADCGACNRAAVSWGAQGRGPGAPRTSFSKCLGPVIKLLVF